MKTCWIDVETTGLDPNRNGIIQIGGIVDVMGETQEEFNLRVRPFPDDVICDEALQVNRMTRDEIDLLPDPLEGFRRLREILSKYVDPYDKADKFHFGGYNCQTFDVPFVDNWFRKCGDKYFGSWFWRPSLDVMVIAHDALRRERYRYGSFRLGSVAKYFGVEVDEESLHDALVDIRLTREIYKAIEKMREAS